MRFIYKQYNSIRYEYSIHRYLKALEYIRQRRLISDLSNKLTIICFGKLREIAQREKTKINEKICFQEI